MVWEFFSEKELQCQCGCGKALMDDKFMKKLISLRKAIGPLSPTSAYRCPAHNAKVSSTGLTGPHTTGRAVDIRANSRQKYKIMEECRKLGITRFGIAKTFIHIDDLTQAQGFDEDVIWAY